MTIKHIENDSVTIELRPGFTGTSVDVNGVQVFWSKSEEKARKFFDVYVEIRSNSKNFALLVAELIELG